MKLIKDDKRGYIHNDTLESLLIAKINGISLKARETTKHLHETIYKKDSKTLKRSFRDQSTYSHTIRRRSKKGTLQKLKMMMEKNL